MNIGVYLGSFQPSEGGGYTFQESLLRKLGQSDRPPFEFTVFFYGKKAEVKGLRMVPIQEAFYRRVFRWVFRMVNLKFSSGLQHAIEKEKIDLVWFTSFSFEPIEIPFIYTVWDLQHRLQPWFPEVSANGQWDSREKMYRQALGRASFILTGTTAGENELVQFYGVARSNIRKLLHPVPEFLSAENSDITKLVSPEWHGNYWFYPAQFWAHKNHIRILLALQLLKKDNQNALAVFCGADKGNLEYLKIQAHKLGVADQILFLGFVSRSQLIALYKNAFVLVFPSYFGPENLPPLEAFALGCPVIASDVDGVKEQLGNAALFFDPGSAESLTSQYLTLRNKKDLRQELIDRGSLRATTYTTAHYLNDIFDILDEFRNRRITWAS